MSHPEKQVLEVPDFLTVRDLASLMNASPIEVMKQLISNGIMATINQQIDYDTAAIVISEMGFEPRPQSEIEEEHRREQAKQSRPEWRKEYEKERKDSLSRRPPVVTILGHVDHGKTSLLDAIRKTAVAEGEAGGITQHIGAYQVKHQNELITFLDTPGHEAFTRMRARGAQGADIAILVVAADDGVMQTTREALDHVRAADVPVIVALNKIDKPNANPDFVKQQLSEVGLIPDDWGGEIMVIPVSARNRDGLEDLMQAILLTASEQEIVANPQKAATGVVLESRLDPSRGPIATLLVQNGTLRVGDVVLAGASHGKIKAMFDEKDQRVQEAPPSKPVSVMGLDTPPDAGTHFDTVHDMKEARKTATNRKLSTVELNQAPVIKTLEDLFARFQAGETNELNLVVKVDVAGSLEPVVNELEKIKLEDKGPKVHIVTSGVGGITENDVNLAHSAHAIIIGFHTEADTAAKRSADAYGVEIRRYTIIYKMVEDIELALKGLLEPVYEDKVVARAEVRKVFNIAKIGAIAGSMILEGEARRNQKARVRRGKEIIAEKQGVSSLKRLTEDVREVRTGFECGIGLSQFHAFEPGDIIEFLETVRVN
jgi:translation initiation factor IF-2